jgi:hypothetical protein
MFFLLQNSNRTVRQNGGGQNGVAAYPLTFFIVVEIINLINHKCI